MKFIISLMLLLPLPTMACEDCVNKINERIKELEKIAFKDYERDDTFMFVQYSNRIAGLTEALEIMEIYHSEISF